VGWIPRKKFLVGLYRKGAVSTLPFRDRKKPSGLEKKAKKEVSHDYEMGL
jgi:hypothetical protein